MLTEGAFTFALFVTHLQNTLSFGRFLCGLKNGSATMKLMASVRLNLCDNLRPQALIRKCRRSSLLSGGASGRGRTGVPPLPRQWVCVSVTLLHAPGSRQAGGCVWGVVGSGAVKVRTEERTTSPKQSSGSQHSAHWPLPSVTHTLLLVYTNKQERKGH